MSFCGSINDLPPQIITDVLSRLPPKTVIRCRCVCKTWQKLLQDPYFADLHLSRSPSTFIVHQFGPHLPTGRTDFLKLVEFDHDRRRLRWDPAMKFDLESACYPRGQIFLVGCVDGVICFCDFTNEVVHITNPIMREYVTLPKPKYRRRAPEVVVYGFGFGPISGSYKVVQIFQRPVYDRYETRVEVYTLGTGRWRSIDIGTSTVDFSYAYRLTSPYLNGNIHWLVFSERRDTISCFDVEKETFRTISTPPSKGYVHRSLVVLEGCLCVCHNSEDSGVVVWVMKEYSVKESFWTKQLAIGNQSSDCLFYDIVSPIKVWGNGEYLFLHRDDYLFNYIHEAEGETVQEIQVPHDSADFDMILSNYEVLFHVANFRSLKEMVTVSEKIHKF